ncbi:hypothetical protein BYT27DRAFT_7190710 [Phlegmacium glaucopus]|nr:hypothetical protein BYT27DRAFT_7190710 [Phlegmacium glaucopus]
MSSSANIPMAAERSDIHKSCKSIENLLNILNEYCEAAGAVFVLQKKLAKALRETAGLKITGDISANALHTSATIFEVLSDIDSKFAKVMDKEYDGISNEVKKWFKKLAREEKAHDERIINANAKIKQAGLAYEKKSKKKVSDAQEEHARYINLISTLGPEISQETQNHALNVTQRHTTTTYCVAACLSRVADAEWQRSCESIRRFSPTVGPLGEWRALCEGGWSGSVPQGLPDIDTSSPRQPQSMPGAVRSIEEDSQQLSLPAQEEIRERTPEFRESTEQLLLPVGHSTSPLAQHSWGDSPLRGYNLPASGSPISKQYFYSATNAEGQADSAPTNLEPPRLPFVDPNTGSVRSLSAFPIPPTHYPLPPPRQQPQQSSISQSAHPSTSNINIPPQQMDPPVSANDDRRGLDDVEESDQTEYQQHTRDNPGIRPRIQGRESDSILPTTLSPNNVGQPTTQPQMTMPTDIRQQAFEYLPHDARHGSSSSSDTRPSNTHPHSQDDYQDIGREFGMDYNAERPPNSRTNDNSKARVSLERADTGSSLVAAMRNRFSNTSGSTSPPPRELPRLPLSVNSLASRYQPADAPLSPKPRTTLPSRQQSLPLVDTPPRQSQEAVYQDHLSMSPQSRSVSNSEDDRQQQRDDDPILSERRKREQQLKEKERELEIRTQELERDRLRLVNMREKNESDGRHQPMLRSRERRVSLQHQLERRLSQMDLDDLPEVAPLGSSPEAASPKPNTRSQYSYNTSLLIPPSSPATNTPPATIHPPLSSRYGQNSQSSSPLQKTRLETQYEQHETHRFPGNNNGLNKDTIHGSSPQPAPLKPQDKSKSGGSWIRRFSVPVGNAFNLDSKRHQSNNSVSSTTSNHGVGSGISSGPVQGGGGGRGLFSMDARKNVSTTALRISGEGGDRVQEDGRLGIQRSGAIGVQGRRSYEDTGLRNRSMTNLRIAAGRQ